MTDQELIERYNKLKREREVLNSKAELGDTKQKCLKIVLNTMYGIMGTKYSAIFDKDLAGSITLTGQTIIKDSISFVDTYFKNVYKFDGNAVVYGDTDSMYVNVKAMADSILGVGADVNDMENIAKLCNAGDKLSEIVNTFCFEKIVKKKMHSDMDWIKFKRESFSSGAMFFSKKRYIMRVRDDEGVPVDKFKYVGVQLKRQELPPLVKDKLKEFVEQSFVELWDNARAQKEMHKLFEWFNNLSVSEISCVSGINSWKDSDGFLRAAKGSGMHLRGAIYHNDLIYKFKLAGKYDIIRPGAKVRYVLIKPNPYKGVNVISFLNEFPKEFEEFLYPDIDKMFAKTVTAPLKHIFSVSGWTPFDKDFDEDFLSI